MSSWQVEVCNPTWKREPEVYPTKALAAVAAEALAAERGLGTGSYRVVPTEPLTLVATTTQQQPRGEES